MINAAFLTDYAKTFSDAVCILAASITLCADSFLDWLYNETWRKAIQGGRARLHSAVHTHSCTLENFKFSSYN